jgi:hypothetical protein
MRDGAIEIVKRKKYEPPSHDGNFGDDESKKCKDCGNAADIPVGRSWYCLNCAPLGAIPTEPVTIH